MTAAPGSDAQAARDRLEAGLSALAPRLVPGAVAVEGLRRLSGGASHETWSFRAGAGAGARDLILRRAPEIARLGVPGCGTAAEAELIRRARATGAPAPEILLELAPEDGLGAGYVMPRIAGETLPARIFRDPAFAPARDGFAAEAGRILAAIHKAPSDGVGLSAFTPEEALAALARRHDEFGAPRPVFSLAIRRLRETAPKGWAPGLVHGDFRMGNIMFGPDRVSAVLDWELAHIGDRHEDFGWLCMESWRFGGEGPVGGLGDRETLFASYEAAGGAPVDRAAARWWETYAALHWGVICEEMGAWVRAGQDVSVERQMIARRASETEVVLMRDLLGEAA